MSRIGKLPIALPAKVEVSVSKGNVVTVMAHKIVRLIQILRYVLTQERFM
jgi:ribosomal protein L6P/L9E